MGVDPLSYFSFQPVLHDWCNKGSGMCYPVCGMVHIKEPLVFFSFLDSFSMVFLGFLLVFLIHSPCFINLFSVHPHQPCNPKHPDFSKTGELCTAQGINDTKTLFRWRVSAPTGPDGVTSDLHDVTSNTFFASTKTITLDSIYFSSGTWGLCSLLSSGVENNYHLVKHYPVYRVRSLYHRV